MSIKTLSKALSACLLLTLAVAAQAESNTVFEMRIYTTYEGKLDALNERFTNHTADFFEQYGMRNVGYWVPTDPEKSGNTLIYILEHESREAAAKSWEGFVNDPDWQKVYEKSREDGPIVKNIDSVYMTATEYSAIR